MRKSLFLLVLFSILHLAFYVDNCMCQWVQMSNGMGTTRNIMCLASNEANIFSGGTGGVYLSTDNGENWTLKGFETRNVWALTIDGTNIYAGIYAVGIARSTNNGGNWDTLYNGLTSKAVRGIAISGTNIFVGTEGGGVFLSTNNGTNWSAINSGLTDLNVKTIILKGTFLFAGANLGHLFVTTNNGINWTLANSGIPLSIVQSFGVCGMNLFAGTSVGIFLSTNEGVNWTNAGITSSVNSIISYGINVFAGCGYQQGIFLTTNNGGSWTSVSQGYGNGNIPITYSLLIANNYILAGTAGQSVWRRPLSEIITGEKNISNEIPSSFTLHQNYPNPFNPLTKIQFDILKLVNVRIEVFDITGKELEVIVDERMQPGIYEVEWNGEKYSSGIFYYRLKAENFFETRKMILMK